MPGGEAADNVGYAFEAKVDQGGGGEARGIAVVAEQHDLLAEAADVRVARGAFWVEAPFEYGPRDVERAGNDAVALAVEIGASVDQENTTFGCGERSKSSSTRHGRGSSSSNRPRRSPQPNAVSS